MFDASGNYSPPDQETPHVLVVTEAFTAPIPAGYLITVAKGTVLGTFSLGHTNVATSGVQHVTRSGRPVTALIEHATAKVGDVLTDNEITPAIAAAAAKQAAVAKYRAAEAAKSKAQDVGTQPLTPEEVTALRKLLSAS